MHALALVLALALPQDAAAGPDPAPPDLAGSLIVLEKSGHRALFIDPGSGATRHALPTGKGPHEVAVSPDGTLAVVADYGALGADGFVRGHTLTVLDLVRGEVARTLDLGDHVSPHGLQFLADGRRLAVTSEVHRALLLVDVTDGTLLQTISTDGVASHMVVLAPDDARAYVANIGSGSLSVLDLEAGELVAVVETGPGCEGVAISPDGSEVWTTNRDADTLSVVDTARLRVVEELPCGRFPIRIKLTPDGARAVVSCAASGEVALIDVAARKELGRLAFPSEVVERAEERLFGTAMAASPTPIGVLVAPDGRRAFVATANADRVAVLTLEPLEVVALHATGPEPDGLGWVPPRP